MISIVLYLVGIVAMSLLEEYTKCADADNEALTVMSNIYSVLETIIRSISTNQFDVDSTKTAVSSALDTRFTGSIIVYGSGGRWIHTQFAMLERLEQKITGDRQELIGHVMGMINVHIAHAECIVQKWSGAVNGLAALT